MYKLYIIIFIYIFFGKRSSNFVSPQTNTTRRAGNRPFQNSNCPSRRQIASRYLFVPLTKTHRKDCQKEKRRESGGMGRGVSGGGGGGTHVHMLGLTQPLSKRGGTDKGKGTSALLLLIPCFWFSGCPFLHAHKKAPPTPGSPHTHTTHKHIQPPYTHAHTQVHKQAPTPTHREVRQYTNKDTHTHTHTHTLAQMCVWQFRPVNWSLAYRKLFVLF